MSWDLNQRLEGYERLLSRQAYLAGDQITLADLFHMPNGIQVLQVRVCEAAVVPTGFVFSSHSTVLPQADKLISGQAGSSLDQRGRQVAKSGQMVEGRQRATDLDGDGEDHEGFGERRLGVDPYMPTENGLLIGSRECKMYTGLASSRPGHARFAQTVRRSTTTDDATDQVRAAADRREHARLPCAAESTRSGVSARLQVDEG